MDNYEPCEVIGSGSFGMIRKVRRKSDGKALARKEIDYRKMTEKEKRQLVAEVNILRELRHPNIVRYYERFVDRENCLIYIIMEYCEGGDLAGLIKRCKKEKDIKPDNVFLDGNNNVKLGDFGLSKIIENPETEFAKTYVGLVLVMPVLGANGQ
ncbi:hypothetical protein HK102_012483 [Quaeritorhiza haematococci]|nr:hypothetical protein HK102_012483 [Quaeritorhiza haematococci]